MSLTLPQLILLNHASSVNADRSKEKSDWEAKKRDEDQAKNDALDQTDPRVWNGKRLSELSSEEMAAYYSDV